MMLVSVLGLSKAAHDHYGFVVAGMLLPPAILIMPFTIALLRKRGFPDNAFLHAAMVVGVGFWGMVVSGAVLSNVTHDAAASSHVEAPAQEAETPSPVQAARPTNVIRDAMLVEARAQIARRDYATALRTLTNGTATRDRTNDPEIRALIDQANAGLSQGSGKVPAGTREPAFDQTGDEIEQLSYWQQRVESIPTTPPTAVEDLWNREDVFEQAAVQLARTASANLTQAQRQIRNRYKAIVIGKQRAQFPVLRAAYGHIVRAALWEQNVEVRVGGSGNRTITWTATMFVDHANIASAQENASSIVRKLRFTRSAYRWASEIGEVNTYSMTPPADEVVGHWDGSAFVPVS